MCTGVATSAGVLGLDGDLRDHLVVRLNQNLANLTDLASAYDQAHWNVAGPNFAQLHELFGRFADQAREYMDMLKSGSPFQVAKVLRDLYRLKGDKDLSFGERRLLDTARSLLIRELALARRVKETVVEGEISQIFGLPASA